MRFKDYIQEATIKKTAIALAKKGYELGKSKHDKKWNITYKVIKLSNGEETWMTPKEIEELVK